MTSAPPVAPNTPGTSSAAPETLTPDPLTAQRIARARLLIERGDYDAAIPRPIRFWLCDPRHPEASELRGRAVASKAAAAPPGRGGPGVQPKPSVPPPPAGPVVPTETITPKPAPKPPDAGESTRASDLADRYTRAKSALDGGIVFERDRIARAAPARRAELSRRAGAARTRTRGARQRRQAGARQRDQARECRRSGGRRSAVRTRTPDGSVGGSRG